MKEVKIVAVLAVVYLAGAWSAYGHSWREHQECVIKSGPSTMDVYRACGLDDSPIFSIGWPLYWFGKTAQWAFSPTPSNREE